MCRGCSSDGRALALQARGSRIDACHLHTNCPVGVVGYHVCLTRRRSPVRTRHRTFISNCEILNQSQFDIIIDFLIVFGRFQNILHPIHTYIIYILTSRTSYIFCFYFNRLELYINNAFFMILMLFSYCYTSSTLFLP